MLHSNNLINAAQNTVVYPLLLYTKYQAIKASTKTMIKAIQSRRLSFLIFAGKNMDLKTTL